MYQSAFRILDLCTHSSLNLINLSWTPAPVVFYSIISKRWFKINSNKSLDRLHFFIFLFALLHRFKNGQNILRPMNPPLHSFFWCILLQYFSLVINGFSVVWNSFIARIGIVYSTETIREFDMNVWINAISFHSSINLINLSWTAAGIVFWVLALNHIKKWFKINSNESLDRLFFFIFLFTLRQPFKNGQNILWPMNLPLNSF